MRFYTTDQLGPNRHLTPEGFLVCKDVAIGRTGEQLYAAGEVPVEPGPDGLIRITRDAEAVFHDDTIASFQGKPITFDHPPVDVTPRNWCELAKGVVQHVRRGSGTSDGLLLADLLITDLHTIQAVRDGLRQVSCGYDAEYEQIRPGFGRQRNIIGNHVALVEKGRCGERCAIGDKHMPTQQPTWKDKLRNIFHAKDAVSFETLLKDMPDAALPAAATSDGALTLDAFTNALSTALGKLETKFEKRFETIEGRLKKARATDADDDPDDDEKKRKKSDDDEEDEDEEKKRKRERGETEDEDEDEDEEKKRKKSEDRASTHDQAPSSAEIQDVFARAEILAPGLKLPTLDRAAKPAAVRDSLCTLRRQALERFVETERGRAAVRPFNRGKDADFSKLTCDALNTVFLGASEIAKRENNYEAALSKDAIAQTRATTSAIVEINKRNKEFWARN